MSSLSIRRALSKYTVQILIAVMSSIVLGILTSLLGLILGPVLSGLLSQHYDPHQLDIQSMFPFRLLPKLFVNNYLTSFLEFDKLPYFLLAVASFKAFLTFLIFMIWENIGEKVVTDFRKAAFSSFVKWQPEDRESAGGTDIEDKISSQITNNLRLTKQYIVRFYGGIPREILQTAFLITALLSISPRLFLYIVVFIVPVGAFIDRSSRAVKRRVKRAINDYSSISSWIEQRFLGIETIKHYKSESIETLKMSEQGESLYKKFFRAAKIKSLTSPVTEFIGIIALAIVIYLSTVSEASESPATLLSFFACLGLLSQSITKLSKYVNARAEGKAAFIQIKDTYSTLTQQTLESIYPPPNSSCKVPTPESAIYCHSLCYSYPNTSENVIDQFSYNFRYGHFYAVFGHSGAGKSTLLKVLLKYFQVESGELFFHYPEESLYPISYLPQNPILIPGTIAENVSYPLKPKNSEAIKSALRNAQIDDLLERFQDGLNHHLDYSDAKLSGGQVQRLNLARVFYLNSRIILADECTSALDKNTEAMILKALRDLANNGSCVIMIAHRPLVLDYADQVLLMDHGKLVKEGAADRLKEDVISLIKSD